MRKAILLTIIIASILLGGCSAIIGSGSVDELLRAPQTSQLMSDIQSALNSFKNDTVQLKYPRGYKEQSPILVADIDSDGIDEAVILYTSEQNGQRVRLAVLENTELGWQVVQDIEGLSSEVMDLELAELAQGDVQIVVGYANATLVDKFLCVYSYKNDNLYYNLETAYTNYLVVDVNESGMNDLLIVSNGEEEGALSAQWVTLKNSSSGMELLQAIVLDSRFVTCNEIYFVKSGDSEGIIIEGLFANGWTANEVFKYTSDSENFIKWPQGETDVPLTTLRYAEDLNVSIVEDSAVLRVPTNVTKISTFNNPNRFYYVTWQDYLSSVQSSSTIVGGEMYTSSTQVESENPQNTTHDVTAEQTEQEDIQQNTSTQPKRNETDTAYGGDANEQALISNEENAVHPLVDALPNVPMPTEPCFGIYDSHYGYFARLPEHWAGNISLTQGFSNDTWSVTNRATGKVLVTYKISAEQVSERNYELIANVGENYLFFSVSNECTQAEKILIEDGVVVF